MRYLVYARTAALIGTVAAGAALASSQGHGVRATATGAATECQIALVGGGPRCPPAHRLVIDVRARGAGLPDEAQLQTAVGLGATSAGVFALPLEHATAADSALYAVIDVERGGSTDFRLAARLAGPRATGSMRCERSANGSDGDVGFGAYLAAYAFELAKCAQHQRRVAGL